MAGRRTSIQIPGSAHAAPIPMGAKVGNIVFSSAISGQDTEHGTLPDDPAEQAAHLFKNIRTFMELVGGSPDDIVKMDVLLRDDADRDYINTEWVKMFPDAEDRPARHATSIAMRGSARFQIELVAVLAS